ncbi:MAG: DUF1853 family protein, partial [Pseudomonadales bacterium]|nr:DUF1853 family protein [Pseudomonadales bacterium]
MQTEDRLARDLDWCLASQPLMSSDAWCAGLALPGRALKLPAPPHPHHFRLGQHFERLLATWLSASPDHELIANNVQVQDGRRTVGEFDFLVRTRQGVEHWEAAIKFYLGCGDGKSLADWYGPNTADRFDIKYERLVSRQLVLSQTEAGQRALREL